MQAVMIAEPLVEAVEQREARRSARAPWPSATARFSVTIGLPVIRSSRPYSATISDQLVSAWRGA